jgi:hypothetical protein
MDPYQFEKLIARLWESYGYETIVRQESSDRGIDIEATKEYPFEHRVVIQVKRYNKNNKIGSEEVRKYATLYMQSRNVDIVIIATSSNFTQKAQILARDLDVKTLNGGKIANQIFKSEDIIDEFDFEESSNMGRGCNNTESLAGFDDDSDIPTESKSIEEIRNEIEKNYTRLFVDDRNVGVLSVKWVKDDKELKKYTIDIKKRYDSLDERIHMTVIPKISVGILNYINSISVENDQNSTEIDLYVQKPEQLSATVAKIIEETVGENNYYVDISFEKRSRFEHF